VSNEPDALSHESVHALLGDLHYVIGEVEPADWPRIAGDVMVHHTPPIDEALLSPDKRNLQKWCRTMLEAMIDVDEEGARAAALKVKQYS
jgi:hypothetical protein